MQILSWQRSCGHWFICGWSDPCLLSQVYCCTPWRVWLHVSAHYTAEQRWIQNVLGKPQKSLSLDSSQVFWCLVCTDWSQKRKHIHGSSVVLPHPFNSLFLSIYMAAVLIPSLLLISPLLMHISLHSVPWVHVVENSPLVAKWTWDLRH